MLEQNERGLCWEEKRCTTFSKQQERNESGVFVAKWIMNVAEKGKMMNCFKSNLIVKARKEIMKKLQIKDWKSTTGYMNSHDTLTEVLKYRSNLQNVISSIPEKIAKMQTEYLKKCTKIEYNESNGRYLIA
jgi:adenylosuccinate lyase